MKNRKSFEKKQRPKDKDNQDDKIYQGRIRKDKIKYRHKNHWLEEEEKEIVKMKMKKKKIKD